MPWLLGFVVLVIYLLTMDRRVSLDNLHPVTRITGVAWLADISAPVTFVLTYPLRWLSPAAVPGAINSFTAICAALTLGLLARSVALLPHDRTQAERQRNPDRQGFFSTGMAWLPMVIAVCACGFQLTFWQHAVAATGEMVDALLFAVMVWCVLEYRAGEKNGWLLALALVNGLSVANNWAMVAFLPGFLIAVIWLKGFFNFFKGRYVTEFLKGKTDAPSFKQPLLMSVLWLAGAVWFFLLPWVASFSHTNPLNFALSVKYAVRNYATLLWVLPFRMVMLLCLSSLLPLFFLTIRWDRLVQKINVGVVFFVQALFHLIHAFFLGICLWTMLGSVFSPVHLQPLFPCLPLYFLVALNIGYYSGYFLIVFGPRVDKSWRREENETQSGQYVAIGAVMLLGLLVAGGLWQKNFPEILRRKNDPLVGYYQTLVDSLPAKGAVILSEDSTRLQFLESRLIESARQSDYLLVDTGLLARYPKYFEYLNARHPQFKITAALTNHASAITNAVALVNWVTEISHTHDLYFMHPYAGFLAELFYPRPHGLLYKLEPYATNAAYAPPLTTEAMAVAGKFWQTLAVERFPDTSRRVQSSDETRGATFWQRLRQKAHIAPEPDRQALMAGGYYSVALDNWAVLLQQNGSLEEAGKWFAQAKELAPQNVVVQLNIDCNRDLQAHKPLMVDTSSATAEKFGASRDWDQTLRQEGPLEEPSACFVFGELCQAASLYRQAIWQFTRSQALAPGATNPPAKLAEIFLKTGQYTNALAATERWLQLAPNNSRGLILRGLVFVEMGQFSRALAPLDSVLNAEPQNLDARLARAVAYLRTDKIAAAKEDYEAVAHGNPAAYPAFYGLAEIAYQTHDTNAAIKNCELYLSNAPAISPDIPQIKAWLAKLKANTGQKN